jgi:hypothetical protein
VSLPVGERLKLRAIERAETGADPSLAARFSLFSRLSRPEGRPGTERLQARAIRRKKRAERAIPGYLEWWPEALLRAAWTLLRAAWTRGAVTGVPALDGGE